MEQLNNASGGHSSFTEALTTARCAKNVFLTVLILSLLIQLTGFVMVRFTKLVAEPVSAMAAEPAAKPNQVQTAATTSAPAEATTMAAAATSEPASAPAPAAATAHKGLCHKAGTAPCADGYKTWYHVFRWLLPATMFLAMISGALLLLTLLFTVMLALLARTPGVEGFLSSFFWAMLLWVLLIPWQEMLEGRFLYGATFTLKELLAQTQRLFWEGQSAGFVDLVAYHLRFMFYPILALAITLYAQSRYALGVRRMNMAISQTELPGTGEKM
jgi:hypothetical protein